MTFSVRSGTRLQLIGAVMFCAVSAFAQGLITTVAGGNWMFPASANSGSAVNAPLGFQRQVTVDPSGNVYAADTNNQLVVKISAGGILTVVAGNGLAGSVGDGGPATMAYLNTPSGLARDSSGNLYIADSSNRRIRKVDGAGTITTFAGTGNADFAGDGGPALNASFRNPLGIAFDAAGNLYIADNNNHRIRKIDTSGTVTTVAGNGNATFSGDGGPATTASLNSPNAVIVDSSGNLYIADTNNQRIRKVSGGAITTFAGTGSSGYSGDGLQATQAQLNSPAGVALDAAGNVYILDRNNNRVRKVSNGIISTVAGAGSPSFSGDGGPAVNATFWNPQGVAVDGSGNFYVADGYNYRVRKISSSGTITTIAGNRGYKFSGDGGPATAAFLFQPNGLTVDSAGSFYISDMQNLRIRKVTAAGIISTIAGNGICCYSGDNGPALSASMNLPGPTAVDLSGNVYFSDPNNQRVRVITSGGIIRTVAGTGTSGFSGDGGPATQANLNNPGPVAVDSAGNLYISDMNNSRIRKVGHDGNITTVAGIGVSGFSGDGGLAITAALNAPGAIAADSQGSFYFTDNNNHRVRKVDTNGIITTFAGNGLAGFCGDFGPAVQACLNTPRGVALDAAGNVLIADTGTRRIRRVNSSGIITTVAGNGNSGYSGDGDAAINATLANPVLVAVDPSGGVLVADQGSDRIRRFTFADGQIAPLAASGTPGGTTTIPVVLSLGTASADGLSFTLSAAANGTAPVISTALAFTSDAALPTPTRVDTSLGPNIISVAWLNAISPKLTGTVHLGDVTVTIPNGAAFGQTYTMQVVGASGSLASAGVSLGPGAPALLTVARSFLVGDVAPVPSALGDWNSDGLIETAGEFGDSALDNMDLIAALRAVTNVPGFRPRGCTDLFDAIDSFPADTAGGRGGDGSLNNLDLIATLRRVSNVDSSRPLRSSRTVSCAAAVSSDAAVEADPIAAQTAGAGMNAPLLFELGALERERGSPRGAPPRIPLYLRARANVPLEGLSFSIGVEVRSATLRFVTQGPAPTLVDTGVPGLVSVAYLDWLRLSANEPLLLGYLEITGLRAEQAATSSLRVFGVEANAAGGSRMAVSFRETSGISGLSTLDWERPQ